MIKKYFQNNLFSFLIVVIFVSFSILTISLAWTEPTANPPSGNVSAPLNVGPTAQVKRGGLILNTGGASNGLIVATGSVGIGTTNPYAKLGVVGGIIYTGDVNTHFGAQISGDDAGRGLFGSNLYLAGDNTLRTFEDHSSYGYSGIEATWGTLKFYTAGGATTKDAVVTPDPRVFIDTNGNVGIGTTMPAARLHIVGPSDVVTDRWLMILDGGGSRDAAISLRARGSDGEIANGLIEAAAVGGHGGGAKEPDGLFFWAYKNNDGDQLSQMVFWALRYNFWGGNIGIGTVADDHYKLKAEGTVAAYGFVKLSDISLKKDIQPLNYGILDKVLKLNPVSFYWKDESIDKEKHFGFIAQEVEKVLPELVRQDSQGKKILDYNELIPYLVRAIQEQQKKIEEQQKKIEELKEKINELKIF